MILKTELVNYHRELDNQNSENKKRGEVIREQLISLLRNSNRNSLMLYSQKQDYVFDLTYACHEATEQFQNFKKTQIPFRNYMANTEQEIGRYDSLIGSLRKMPAMMLSDRTL